MVTYLLIAAGVVVVIASLFLGSYLGYRTGFRDGRRSARATTEAHWADLLELTLNEHRSRAAHPSRPTGNRNES